MRKIIEVTEEIRRGPMADARVVEGTDFSSCMNAINRLNGLDRTLVSIAVSDGLILVGGGDGAYVVTMDLSDRIVNVVNDELDQDDFVTVTVGGQSVDYPAIYVVSIQMVELALREYLLGDVQVVGCEVQEK